jgi:hypothetical protein
MMRKIRQVKAIRPEALSPGRCRNENGPLEPESKKRIQKGKEDWVGGS